PPITMGPIAVEGLRELDITLDVHLMIEQPERHIAEFAKAGAHNITFHAEATPHVNYTVAAIRDLGCRAGVAVCPSTPPDVYREIDTDVALCMTVNPGWGGQRVIESSLDKIRRIRDLIGDATHLEADGGTAVATAGPCADAGATLFVAGSAVFGSPAPAAAYQALAAAVAAPALD